MKSVDKQKLNVLQSETGRRAEWISVALFWLSTISMATVFIVAGKILNNSLSSSMTGAALISNTSNKSEYAIGTVATNWIAYNRPLLIAGALAILIVFLAKFCETRLETVSQVNEENRLRLRLIQAAFKIGPARVKRDQLGRLVNLATELAEKFTVYAQSFLPQVKGSFTAPLLLIVLMGIFVHPLLALLMIFSLPLIPVGVAGFMKLFRKVSSGSAQARSSLAAAYLDALGGLTTLQLLGAAERVGKDLEAVGEENRQATMRLLRSNQVVIFVLDAIFSLFAVTSAAALIIYLLISGDILIGEAFTGMGLALLLLEPIDHVGAFFYIAMGGRGAGREILDFLKSAQNLHQTHLDKPIHGSECVDNDIDLETAVELNDVKFSYGEADILNGANLQVAHGERVAIVGTSGEGKTTLLNLAKGFLTPCDGHINVAGKTAELAAQSALVSQNTWLFTGSVRENLAIANPMATEDELWKALRMAHLDAEIRLLPEGLDTKLGENGAGLSSGQKQRLSLARALVSGRKILLLDEATSQVDLASEREILAALGELGRDYTLLMVTHRTAVCKLADRTVEVVNGKVKEL